LAINNIQHIKTFSYTRTVGYSIHVNKTYMVTSPKEGWRHQIMCL